jgi:hypothetical protein
MRTQAAIDCRKSLIERFGMDRNAPFVDVARRLIDEDHLLVECDVSTRPGALAFLTAYSRVSKYRAIRPMPAEFRN